MKIYTNQEIIVNDTKITFCGKLDKNILTVTKYNGDVTIMEESLQNFCVSKGINQVIFKFS